MRRDEYRTSEDLELIFLAGTYDELPIDPDKRYLLKYFKTDVQRRFLKYYIIFGNAYRFQERTGYHITERYCEYLVSRIKRLDRVLKRAKVDFDFNLIEKICNGKLRLRGRDSHVGS